MKKKLLSTLLCVSMVSAMLMGCGKDTGNADSGSDNKGTTAETSASEAGTSEGAATDTQASADGGKVYYLNFKPEVDEAWQEIAAA